MSEDCNNSHLTNYVKICHVGARWGLGGWLMNERMEIIRTKSLLIFLLAHGIGNEMSVKTSRIANVWSQIKQM